MIHRYAEGLLSVDKRAESYCLLITMNGGLYKGSGFPILLLTKLFVRVLTLIGR